MTEHEYHFLDFQWQSVMNVLDGKTFEELKENGVPKIFKFDLLEMSLDTDLIRSEAIQNLIDFELG